jgi:peptide/nickel transport system substrate-binding protein
MDFDTGSPISDLIRAARRGRLSRRQFMEGALVFGLTIPAATSMWSTQVAAATPKKGGTFRAGVNDANTTDNLDPGLSSGLFMIQMNHVFRSFLTEITPENKVGPDAAESWDVSPDAKEWRFKLHPGQQFHNGKPLTAADAAASLNFHRGADSKSGGKGLLVDVDEVKADGNETVVVKMKLGTADLPYILADYHLTILPSDGEGKVDWASGIGSGPYKLDSFEPGVAAKFSRYANYHRTTYFDAVHMVGLNDTNARVNGVVTGELDAISDVDLKTLNMLKRKSDLIVDEVPSGQVISMDMDCRTAPLDNVDVRQALKWAFPREEVLQKIVLGHGTVGNDQPIAPMIPFAAKLEQRVYDPDKAKFHLKKAGMEKLPVTLSASDAAYNGAVDMCEIYVQRAAAAGININVVREPADGYWAKVWQHRPFFCDNNGQRGTPDMMFSTFYRDGAPWNPTKWHDDRFQKLLLEAKGELDDKKRAAMYQEMQQLCRDEGGTIVAFFTNLLTARRSNVMHGDHLSSEWQLDGGRAYQRWWFQS